MSEQTKLPSGDILEGLREIQRRNLEEQDTRPPIGAIGRVVNANKGPERGDWGADFQVTAYVPGNPPKLAVESVARLRRWHEPTREQAGYWEVDENQAAETSHGIPVEWFVPHASLPSQPSQPAKPSKQATPGSNTWSSASSTKTR